MKKLYWPLIAIGVVALLAQGLAIPFWGDDYVFLLQAEQARAAAEPWWSGLWPTEPDKFWRPLGEEAYWRMVAGPLGSDPVLAHAVNLLAHLLAALAVAWLVTGLIAIKWPEMSGAGVAWVAGLFYLIHAAHFLPLVWAAAANSSIVVLLSALSLGCWIRGYGRSALWLILSIVCLVLALLSKESAIVLPSLAAILGLWLWPQRVPNRATWITAVSAIGVSIAWLLARDQLVVADQAYGLELGTNVPRNAASLLAFALNAPREALRFVVTEQSWLAGLWALTCIGLQLVAVLLLLSAAWRRLSLRDGMSLAALAVVGSAPYYFLARDGYAYYVTLSLIAYAVLAGLANVNPIRVRAAAGIALLAALLSTAPSHFLPSPSLLERAHWGEANLSELVQQQRADPAAFTPPLWVLIDDEQRFYAVGLAGLQYRLGLQPNDVISARSCAQISGQSIIRLPPTGPARVEVCR